MALSEQEILRREALTELRNLGIEPYPAAEFITTAYSSEILADFEKFEGKEVVQLYIRDEVGTITRPVKELKGFEKIELAAGQTKEVVFEITTELLKFYNSDLKFDWESGDFQIMVGPNSRDVKAVKVNWVK